MTVAPDPIARAQQLLNAADAAPNAVTIIEAHPDIERFLRAASSLVASLLGVIRERDAEQDVIAAERNGLRGILISLHSRYEQAQSLGGDSELLRSSMDGTGRLIASWETP